MQTVSDFHYLEDVSGDTVTCPLCGRRYSYQFFYLNGCLRCEREHWANARELAETPINLEGGAV